MSSNQIAYTYVNRSMEAVEVWLSAAPGTRNIRFSGGLQPIERQDHDFLGSIYYFQIPSKQKLTYTSQYSPVQQDVLTGEERAYFLKNSRLIPVNEDTKKTAAAIVENSEAETDQGKVRAIFNYVKDTYKYSATMKQRGFDYTVEQKAGDCGELSAVVASYCRSLQIPCRMMVGAFKGKSNHHVWNEVYLPGEGWVPLDVSLAMYTFFKHPFRNLGAGVKWGALINKNHYFGAIESGRAVFSIDPERQLSPPYIDANPPVKDMTSLVAGETFSWGYESLDGSAPYMQPIYPKLNQSYASIKYKDVLGKFEIYSASLIDKLSYQTKMNALSLGAVLVYLSILLSLFNIETTKWFNLVLGAETTLAFGVFSLLTLLRHEFNWAIFVLSILLSLSAFSFIYGMAI